MTDIAETALAFAKECIGWDDAGITDGSDSPNLVVFFKSMDPIEPAPDYFEATNLAAVMDSVSRWCFERKCNLEIKIYPDAVRVWVMLDGEDLGCGKSDDDLCAALMSACLEAGRRFSSVGANTLARPCHLEAR
jgi:predicted signal transduction protein with EAL and GGDEF domain